MMEKKYWAERFQQALQNKDSLERYAICTNWLNDFKSQLMIVQEIFDFDMDGGEISQLLSSENKFDNSKLIKQGDFEERRNLINKMKELQKDSIKTMMDYFMINPSLIVNKDFCLIGRDAYEMLTQLTNGGKIKLFNLFQYHQLGPNIRLFIDQIKSDTELKDKVITGFMEGNDNLNENEFVDLNTIQLGITIKYQDKTIIEVGYYPQNKSLSHILYVITKRLNIDYTTMVVDLRKSPPLTQKENQCQLQNDIKMLQEQTNEKLFYYKSQNNKTITQYGLQRNDIILFTDQYHSKQINEKEEEWLFDADLLNFKDECYNQSQNPEFQNTYSNEPMKYQFQKNIIPEQLTTDFSNRLPNILNNRQLNSNILNSDNDALRRQSSIATLDSTYDSQTQIHNNSANNICNNGINDKQNCGKFKILNGGNNMRNNLKRNKNSDDSTEGYDNYDKETEDYNYAQFSMEASTQIPRQIIGFSKSQEEIDQIKAEIKNSIGKGGTLQMKRLPDQLIGQNLIQMINQMNQVIQEQLYQRAKQDKNSNQTIQTCTLRQYRDYSHSKGEDSERTSSTSTQPENIKKKKCKSNSNIVFDEPNNTDLEEGSQVIN